MNLAFSIATRYLFGKKSTNAINLITGISVVGIAIGTAALILILSVFNGFEGLMKGYLDSFNPDLKIVATEGKFFDTSDVLSMDLKSIAGIEQMSVVIEEVALLEYNDRQQVGIIKGVDEEYLQTTSLENAIKEGSAIINDAELGEMCIVGMGIYNNLNISLLSKFRSLKIYVPNRKRKGPLDKDFKSRPLLVSGVFAIQNERDNKYAISSYDMVSRLLDLSGQASAIEIKLTAEANEKKVAQIIQKKLGSGFEIQNRYQQDESFLRIMNIEKWSSYLIFGFTLLLIIFNVIGSLWMIVLDKRKDLSVMQSFGAPKSLIKRIFYFEGSLISLLGFSIGFLFAIIFYILQKEIGIITVPDGFAIQSYPIDMRWTDVLIVWITVMLLGILASIPAAIRASRVSAYVRVE